MKQAIRWMLAGMLVTLLGHTLGADPKPQEIKLSMSDFAFSPKKITLKAGVPVEMTIVNVGKVVHEVLIYDVPKSVPKSWDDHAIPHTFFQNMGEIKAKAGGAETVGTNLFEFEVEAGKSMMLEFTPNKKGTFEVGCHVAGHYENGMKATLVVE